MHSASNLPIKERLKPVYQRARESGGFPLTCLHPHAPGHTRGVRDIAVATVAAADVPSGAGEEGPAGWAAAGVGPSGVGVSGRADGGGGATGGGSRAAGGSTVLLASAGWDNRLIVWDLQVGGQGNGRRGKGLSVAAGTAGRRGYCSKGRACGYEDAQP